jgi:anti-sigma28 factor (negative regulator of flagellin synthesis)
MSRDEDEGRRAPEDAQTLEEDSDELPSRVIVVNKDVWRASRLEYITKNVRAGRYQVDVERLADTLLPQIDELTRRRK